MPLVRSFWLSTRNGNEAWVRCIPDPINKQVNFEIGHSLNGPPIARTKQGKGTGFVCLICQSPATQLYIHDEIDGQRGGIQLMAKVAYDHQRRSYFAPSAEDELAAERERPSGSPDEPARGTFGGNAQGRRYGFRTFADYFTNRQLIALCTFSDLVGEARERVLHQSGGDTSYADAIATYLALAVSRGSRSKQYHCHLVEQPRSGKEPLCTAGDSNGMGLRRG